VLAASLLACQPPDPDTPFATYTGLLGRTPGAAGPSSVTTSASPFPDRRDLRSPTDRGPATLLPGIDLLDLSGCALQSNLIRSRSTLGRHAKSSQRLLLALDYLRQAPPCASRLRQRGRDTLADTLRRGWSLRREQLVSRIFDATLGSDEYRSFWRARPTPGAYPRVRHAETLAVLQGINDQVRRWLAGDYRTDNLEFELLLGEVAGGGGGALLRALARQADWLATADRLLREQAAGYTFCDTNGKTRVSARRLVDARRYFERELRPRISTSLRQSRELLGAIAALEAMLDAALPPRYRDWRDSRSRYVQSLQYAPIRHLDLLTQVGQTCTRP
jgi:hypothetical protein